MNSFLAELLRVTSASRDGYWTDDQLAMLDEAQRSLGPALDAHEDALRQLGACQSREAAAWADLLRVGEELGRQARSRVAQAPELLAYVRAIRAVKEWRVQQLAEQKSERATWCAPKPGRMPVVYFAWQDAVGRTEWLFCDGAKVVEEGEKPAEYVRAAPSESRRRYPLPARAYLIAASKFPESEIRRSPKLPDASAPVPQDDATGEGDEDGAIGEGGEENDE